MQMMLEKGPDRLEDPRIAESPMTATLDPEEDRGATFPSDRIHERLRLSDRDESIPIAVDHQQRRIVAVDELDGTRGSRQLWMLLHRTADQLRFR